MSTYRPASNKLKSTRLSKGLEAIKKLQFYNFRIQQPDETPSDGPAAAWRDEGRAARTERTAESPMSTAGENRAGLIRGSGRRVTWEASYCVTRGLEGWQKEVETEKVFKEILAGKVPNLAKDTNLWTQKPRECHIG